MLQLTTIFFVISLSVLAVLHILALKLFLYWHFPWLDIPMHLIGGMVAALGVFALYDFQVIPRRWLHFSSVFLLCLIAIFGWEVFKLYTGKEIDDEFVLDTVTDVAMGSVGSIIGFYVARSLRSL